MPGPTVTVLPDIYIHHMYSHNQLSAQWLTYSLLTSGVLWTRPEKTVYLWIATWLTRSRRNEVVDIWLFSNGLHGGLFLVANWKKLTIGSGNGLVPKTTCNHIVLFYEDILAYSCPKPGDGLANFYLLKYALLTCCASYETCKQLSRGGV